MAGILQRTHDRPAQFFGPFTSVGEMVREDDVDTLLTHCRLNDRYLSLGVRRELVDRDKDALPKDFLQRPYVPL